MRARAEYVHVYVLEGHKLIGKEATQCCLISLQSVLTVELESSRIGESC